MRKVEMNPVCAGLVADPQQHEWSSAEAHLSGEDPARIADVSFWRAAGGASDWVRLLDEPGVDIQLKALRRAGRSGQPSGDKAFTEKMNAQRPAVWAKMAGDPSPSRGVEVLIGRS
ncbi:hypothetical protein [uncultured Paludibaculum sp.]|uniref:hypothetical protein n=1 Tax=uncultured Paludibaculum sp. TaxID=1765020 RepID=UPI002AABAB16|nr:hypothetical protein [uncultured Paludibaculum sp.]